MNSNNGDIGNLFYSDYLTLSYFGIYSCDLILNISGLFIKVGNIRG